MKDLSGAVEEGWTRFAGLEKSSWHWEMMPYFLCRIQQPSPLQRYCRYSKEFDFFDAVDLMMCSGMLPKTKVVLATLSKLRMMEMVTTAPEQPL